MLRLSKKAILGQGLLNSEAELDELLERVLGHHIASGICEIARDTIQKGVDTVDQATHHWELILSALLASNLKLTARKVRFFPEQTEIYGWKHNIDGSIRPHPYHWGFPQEINLGDRCQQIL